MILSTARLENVRIFTLLRSCVPSFGVGRFFRRHSFGPEKESVMVFPLCVGLENN